MRVRVPVFFLFTVPLCTYVRVLYCSISIDNGYFHQPMIEIVIIKWRSPFSKTNDRFCVMNMCQQVNMDIKKTMSMKVNLIRSLSHIGWSSSSPSSSSSANKYNTIGMVYSKMYVLYDQWSHSMGDISSIYLSTMAKGTWTTTTTATTNNNIERYSIIFAHLHLIP